MSGATRMVIKRSRSFGSVRAAMMPGMAHAYDDSSGTTDAPERPRRRITRSMMKAVRAM